MRVLSREVAREAGAAVVDVDGSPHSMASGAIIAASPKLVADIVEAQKIAKHSLGRYQGGGACAGRYALLPRSS